MAMQDDFMTKAPGMKFSINVRDKTKPTPRVIHALGKLDLGVSHQTTIANCFREYQMGIFGWSSAYPC
jgi:hypothetical protein